MTTASPRPFSCLTIVGLALVLLGCGSDAPITANPTPEPSKVATETADPIIERAEPEATKIPALRPDEHTITVHATAHSNAVDLQIDTNIPGIIEIMASINFKGQAPDDVYIGESRRVGIIDGSTTVRFDTSGLPTGEYEAEANFYPRWGFQDELSRSTGITQELTAVQEIRLGGSGQPASAAQFRSNSQAWVMGNVGMGDPWKEEDWTRRFGSYERLPVEGLNPNVIDACYFPNIDMTIFVNKLKHTVSHWRIGRSNR